MTALLLSGCSVNRQYTPPQARDAFVNTRVVALPRDEAWRRLVAGVSGRFFVINTIERDSGLISISYAGDPERYVDCGFLKVKTSYGEVAYPVSKASTDFREARLNGRMNIIVQPETSTSTRVTVNTRYAFGERFMLPGGPPGGTERSVSFTGDEVVPFGSTGMQCRATGILEQSILSIL